MQVIPASEVEKSGYAKFNMGPHLCVDVPDGWYTISCKTPDGKMITFAFIPDSESDAGHSCVDVHHATAAKKKIEFNEQSYECACQEVIVFGQGFYTNPFHSHDYYAKNSDKPMTLTTILLNGSQLLEKVGK